MKNALEAYWGSQNRRLGQLESFLKQGGSLSAPLLQDITRFEEEELAVFHRLLQGQKQLSSTNSHPIKRLPVRLMPCPGSALGESVLPCSGTVLLMGVEDAYAQALAAYLESHGLHIRHIPADADEAQAQSQVASAGELAGLVVLGNSGSHRQYILSVAAVIKHFVIRIRQQKTDRRYLFLFATFMDGKLGTTGVSADHAYGAFGGMAKCVGIELFGSVYAKAVDLEPTVSPDAMVRILDAELRCHDGHPEVGRTADGMRWQLQAVEAPAPAEKACPLTESDVLLVTGGARGVTANCILALAKQVKCTFVLLGRMALSEAYDDDAETAAITDPTAMKALIAKRFKAQGYQGSLRVIEATAKAILAQREIRQNLQKLRATGNRVEYYPCDVNDRAAVAQTVAAVENALGKITAVVHGAGVVADCKIWNKSMDAFRRVFDTKYQGLHNLMDHVDMQGLKLLVMFSSVSAFFGNDGQIDYVAGNMCLDKYAYYVRNRYPNCRALSINWGAWNGGMVNLDALYVHVLQEKGYVLIPLEVGAAYFVEEICAGLPEAQLLINNTADAAFDQKKGD